MPIEQLWRMTPHDFRLAVEAYGDRARDERRWQAHLCAFVARTNVDRKEQHKITADKLTGESADTYKSQKELDDDMRARKRRAEAKPQLDALLTKADGILHDRLQRYRGV